MVIIGIRYVFFCVIRFLFVMKKFLVLLFFVINRFKFFCELDEKMVRLGIFDFLVRFIIDILIYVMFSNIC